MVAVALGEGQWWVQVLQANSCPCGIKSKRAHFVNVLYLAHQLWELIPLGDHSERASSSKEMQSQERLPSDPVHYSLCHQSRDWPTACRELHSLEQQLGQEWNRMLAGRGAGWRPSDWRMMQPGPNTHTCSAWGLEERWMRRDLGQRQWPDGPLGEKCLAVGTQTRGKDHSLAKPNSQGMKGSLGWNVGGSSHHCLCFSFNAELWLQ